MPGSHRAALPQNLTMPCKWAVMKESLCDRQSKIIRPHFSARGEAVSRSNGGEETARHTKRKSVPQNRITRVAVLLLCLISGLRGFGQEPAPEYQIKAAFLFNFAKFVDWPPGAFSNDDSPIVIGVLGKNVFGHYLDDTIRNKTVNNRKFEFKELTSANEATNCQILFISPSEKDNLAAIVNGLHNASVLTVSETDQFIKAGGMINFLIEDNKVRFQISDKAARKAGLRISSKLLSLAARNH